MATHTNRPMELLTYIPPYPNGIAIKSVAEEMDTNLAGIREMVAILNGRGYGIKEFMPGGGRRLLCIERGKWKQVSEVAQRYWDRTHK